MSVMASLNVPTIAAIIGQGGSEGALALAIADRVLMMQNAIYTVMAPEEAASIMFDKSTTNEEAAESLRLTAADCLELNIVDEIVGEPLGAHESPDAAARQLRRFVLTHLTDIGNWSNFRRSRRRYRKFRQIGEFTKKFGSATGLNPSPSSVTDHSESISSRTPASGLYFQETTSLEKIDPLDHDHEISDD